MKHNYSVIIFLMMAFIYLEVIQSSAQNANTALSNLISPTSVNQTLFPSSDNALDLGSSSKSWKNIYLDGSVYLNSIRFLSNGGNTNNAFTGYNAGKVTTGVANSFFGAYSGYSNTTGHDNTGLGYFALYNNATTYENTAIGSLSLFSLGTGYYNTAIGFSALFDNYSGYYNTAVGSNALDATESSGNTAVGERAGAIYANGWGCTFLGQQNWANADGYQYSMSLGYNCRITASYQTRIGDATTTSIGGYANWTKISDSRVKKDIKEDVPGLSFINRLKPVTYHLDMEKMDEFLNPDKSRIQSAEKVVAEDKDHQKALDAKGKVLETGFLAQDVEKAAQEVGYDFSGVDAPKNDKDMYGLRYAEFVVPLVKAVQELSKANDEKNEKINSLESRIALLEEALAVNSGEYHPESKTVSEKNDDLPALSQNVPNPFDHSTTIHFHLPDYCPSAQIVIMETASDKIVKTFSLSCKDSQITVDSNMLQAGNYTYSLVIDGKIASTKQMVIVH